MAEKLVHEPYYRTGKNSFFKSAPHWDPLLMQILHLSCSWVSPAVTCSSVSFFMSQNSNKHNIICFITWSHYPSWHKHGKHIKPSLWIKPTICYINYKVQLNMSKLGCYVRLDIVKFYIFTLFAGADPGVTHTKYPKNVRTSLRSAQLF